MHKWSELKRERLSAEVIDRINREVQKEVSKMTVFDMMVDTANRYGTFFRGLPTYAKVILWVDTAISFTVGMLIASCLF